MVLDLQLHRMVITNCVYRMVVSPPAAACDNKDNFMQANYLLS
jgi:hypothetical protein